MVKKPLSQGIASAPPRAKTTFSSWALNASARRTMASETSIARRQTGGNKRRHPADQPARSAAHVENFVLGLEFDERQHRLDDRKMVLFHLVAAARLQPSG